MKAIPVLCIALFLCIISNGAEAQEKKNRKEKQAEAMAITQKLIDSGRFIFVPDRAFPQGGRSIDLTTNYGFITIDSGRSTADLPFFGRAFQVEYGSNGGGIKFEGEMRNTDVRPHKKKKAILYSFEVQDKDNYQIHMEITSEGGTYVNVVSNNRSFISYSGTISALKDPEDQ